MRYPVFLILFFIFALYFSYKVKRARTHNPVDREQLQKLEMEAYYVRPQPIEEEHFLIPNTAKLPFLHNTLSADNTSADMERLLKTSQLVFDNCGKKMLHFADVKNLDLKYRYGAKNLEVIIGYETNYENYLESLILYAELLAAQQYQNEAVAVLEEAIAFGCDTSKAFMLLSDLYAAQNQVAALFDLKKKAFLLNSLLKGKIVSYISDKIDSLS